MIKEINVLSWGGGTQSTALLLLFLNNGIIDENGKPINLDYIMFADTKNEASFVYSQVYKVQEYVQKKYGKQIIITSRNKDLISDIEAEKRIKETALNYRRSEYSDLFQSHILYFKGLLKTIDLMPFWVRDENGKVGKTPFKHCTIEYKVQQVMREIKKRENIMRFDKRKQHVNFYLGFTVDEMQRLKDNPKSYASNRTPLVDMNWSKQNCITYVEQEMGFKPVSSVCNMCFANDFDRCYNVFKNDLVGWKRLVDLDDAMENKPKNHSLKQACYMFKWQAVLGERLKNIDMEDLKVNQKSKMQQLNIFETEEAMACLGGCFL